VVSPVTCANSPTCSVVSIDECPTPACCRLCCHNRLSLWAGPLLSVAEKRERCTIRERVKQTDIRNTYGSRPSSSVSAGHQRDDRQPPGESHPGGAAGAAGVIASRGRATGPKAAPLPWALPLVADHGNPVDSCPLAMPLTTADIGIQLLMDSTVSLQEIEARITARVFAAVHHPERGPAVRAVLEKLLAVLDATSPDGVI
jgi:hypothetical protein